MIKWSLTYHLILIILRTIKNAKILLESEAVTMTNQMMNTFVAVSADQNLVLLLKKDPVT
ncbi:hypothetical protein LAC03_08290 [Levilactobacillus acidifarinae]|nr:hypothetical protein LAC03_08290 [Levilactobacillus acidifarinae]